MKSQHGFPFIALGVAFIAIGATGKLTFVAIGIVFLILGFGILARCRKC